MGRLDGRTALVTGASRGIGEHSARALAAEGARVALAARSTVDLERIASELDGAVVIESDLSQPGAGADLAAEAVAALGGVDILVNNAGVGEQPGDEAGVMQINYIAPLETSNALVGQMAERNHGSVIHMSSLAALGGIADGPTYSASKAAITSLCRTQARNFGSLGVRVNAVAPGLITTEMWAPGRQVPGLADALERHIALGRWGVPEEIASVVAFLAGDDARYITGHTIVVDGGFEGSHSFGNGYLLKDCLANELIVALETVTSHGVYLSSAVAGGVVRDYVGRLAGSKDPGHANLTPREREVLKLIAEGLNTKEIGVELCISAKTVASHREHLAAKLGIQSVAGLTRYAIRRGITSADYVGEISA